MSAVRPNSFEATVTIGTRAPGIAFTEANAANPAEHSAERSWVASLFTISPLISRLVSLPRLRTRSTSAPGRWRPVADEPKTSSVPPTGVRSGASTVLRCWTKAARAAASVSGGWSEATSCSHHPLRSSASVVVCIGAASPLRQSVLSGSFVSLKQVSLEQAFRLDSACCRHFVHLLQLKPHSVHAYLGMLLPHGSLLPRLPRHAANLWGENTEQSPTLTLLKHGTRVVNVFSYLIPHSSAADSSWRVFEGELEGQAARVSLRVVVLEPPAPCTEG
eukprot:scaffold96549_cov60-Phaeocystis_antarctica.AAC.3